MSTTFHQHSRFLGIAAVMTLALAEGFASDQPKKAGASLAPVPSQILSGKRVFVSNAGQDNFETTFVTIFSGQPDRIYNEFYAAMKEWGRYELVSAPADADLIFEVSFTLGDNGIRVPELGRLRVTIRDPRSSVVLWTLTQHVHVALRKGNRDKHLDDALDVIVGGLKDLAARSPANPKS